jgi:hypothetical protein
MGSGAVINVPSLRKFGSGIQKLIGGYTETQTHRHTHRQQGDLISLLLFFKIRKGGENFHFFKIKKVGYKLFKCFNDVKLKYCAASVCVCVCVRVRACVCVWSTCV